MRAEATAWLLGGLRVRTCVVFGTDLVGGGSPSLASASGSGTVSYVVFSLHSSMGKATNSL